MERQSLLLKDEMSTEQTVCGIPDMLILTEEIVKMAEKSCAFRDFKGICSRYISINFLGLADSCGPFACDAFSPLPLSPKNYQVMVFLNLFHFSSFLLHLKIVLSFRPPCGH